MHTDCFHGMSDLLIHFRRPDPLLAKLCREGRAFLPAVVEHQYNTASSYVRGYLTLMLCKKGVLVLPLVLCTLMS